MDTEAIIWGDELSPFDYMMFRADMDRRSRTSMMYIETLDRSPDEQRFRDALDRASRVVPRLRQHVVAPLLPLAPAQWIVDPDFDLDYHVRWISLPPPGDFRHLLDLAQTLHAAPLDLGRPLWEVTVVLGLDEPDAEAALCWKLSHTVTDGIGGMVLDQMIRSIERDPDLGPMPPLPVPEDLTPLDLTRRALRRLPRSLVTGAAERVTGAARTLTRAAADPAAAVADVASLVADVRKLRDSTSVEPSPLLKRRGLNRRFEALDVAFRDLRAFAKAHECSVNDAYLTALGGALRRYHEQLGMPVESISVGMPISIRSDNDVGAGNRWTAAVLAIPIAEVDPVKRMRMAREQVLTARTGSSLDPAQIIAPVLAWLPQQLMAGAGAGSLGIDVQASNVPGHPLDRYIAGSQVMRVVPIGPLPGVAMMATMVSMSGQCYVGVNYDTAAVTEPDLFAQCLRQGFDEVLDGGPPPARKAMAGKAAARKKAARKSAARKPTARKVTAGKATKRSTSPAQGRRP